MLVAEVCKALFLINSHNIVHSDLKTENILLRVRREESSRGPFIRGVKLIDFGSSFLFTNLKQFSMATPEYMPPEILNYILFQNKLDYDHQMLAKMERYKNPWTIDIWSLGCIVLEIVTGVPLWMSIETRIEGQEGLRVTGLFAVKNRVFSKIIQKQIEVVSNLDYHLDHHVPLRPRRTTPASPSRPTCAPSCGGCSTSTPRSASRPSRCSPTWGWRVSRCGSLPIDFCDLHGK